MMPCEEYKRVASDPGMAIVDNMPPEYRQLVYEYDLSTMWQFWSKGVPAAYVRHWIKSGFIKLHG